MPAKCSRLYSFSVEWDLRSVPRIWGVPGLVNADAKFSHAETGYHHTPAKSYDRVKCPITNETILSILIQQHQRQISVGGKTATTARTFAVPQPGPCTFESTNAYWAAVHTILSLLLLTLCCAVQCSVQRQLSFLYPFQRSQDQNFMREAALVA